MAIYTSYDMILDCRAGKPDGWIWFVHNLLGPCRTLIVHYGGDEEALRRFLLDSRSKLAKEDPAPVRELLTRWRPRILEAAGPRPSKDDLTLELLSEAFTDLSPLERLIFWLETMGYSISETALMLHLADEAVQRARDKSADLLRARMDNWSRRLPAECGPALGEAARAAVPEEPATFREFIEIVDGRLTWNARMQVDRKLISSWHEVDHFCRVWEADYATVHSPKLTAQEAQPYLDLLGVQVPKPPLWKRILAPR